jgi:betaine-homocysteine S-methyltransferase
VITITIHRHPEMREGDSPVEACKRLKEAGADVVGLNCSRGPDSMLPLLGDIRQAVDGHIAALPVPYRTHDAEPSFQSLQDDAGNRDLLPGGRPFPTALDPFTCNRYEIAEFARAAADLGVNYLGVCCGAAPHHIRSMAEALGRTPEGSRYSADMSKHAYFGTDPTLQQKNREYAEEL